MDINECVAAALDELEWGIHEAARMKRLMFRCVRTMRWDFIGKILCQRINVLPNKTAVLPEAFLKERKIGLLNSDGEIATFYENTNLSLVGCGDRVESVDITRSDDKFEPIEGSFAEPRINSTYGSNAVISQYRIDRINGMIVFDPGFPYPHFDIEFNSSTNAKGNCDIPEMVSEAVVAFGVYFASKSRKETMAQDKADRLRRYNNELRLAKSRVRKINKSRMNQTSRNPVRQTVKG